MFSSANFTVHVTAVTRLQTIRTRRTAAGKTRLGSRVTPPPPQFPAPAATGARQRIGGEAAL
jgi:hypothetical protein